MFTEFPSNEWKDYGSENRAPTIYVYHWRSVRCPYNSFEILFLPRCAHNRTFTHFIEQETMKFPLHFTLVTKCKQNQIIYASNMKRELNHLNDIDFQSLILFVFLQLMFGYWFQSKQLIRFIYNDAMGICVGSAN